MASSRLRHNLIYTLERKQNFKADEKTMNHLYDKPMLFKYFVGDGKIQQLKICIKNYQLQQLKDCGYSFPDVRELEFTLHEEIDDDHKNHIEIIGLNQLTELFPQIISVKPIDNHFHVEIYEKWTQLQRMDLTETLFLDPDLCPISMRSFQQLEELVVNDCDYFNITTLDSILALPKLRTFCFGCVDDFYEVTLNRIIDRRADHIERLDVLDIHVWFTEIQMWQAVGRCDSLQVLSIYHTHKRSFFVPSRSHMEAALSRRITPLTLCCYYYMSNEDENQVVQSFNHPKLLIKFVLDEQADLFPVIKLEFTPLGNDQIVEA